MTKYGWYNSLYMASDGDLKKMKEMEQMKVYEVLTFIAYKIDEGKYREEQYKTNLK